MLAHGAQVDARHSSGATPLVLASQEGHQSCVELLLRAGASVDSVTSVGASSLFVAAQNDHSDVCRVLIEAGCNVELADALGATPLIAAAQNGHSETVRVLVREGNANLNARLGRKTVLECAVSRGREATAIVLVGLGAVALNVFDLDAEQPKSGARKQQERKKELALEARGVRKERSVGAGPVPSPLAGSPAKQLRQYQAEVERLQSELEDAKRTARAWRAAFIASLQVSKRVATNDMDSRSYDTGNNGVFHNDMATTNSASATTIATAAQLE